VWQLLDAHPLLGRSARFADAGPVLVRSLQQAQRREQAEPARFPPELLQRL
jgi:hypothetical protein